MRITIHRALPGRRVGKSCRRPSRRLRNRRKCTRYVRRGTLTRRKLKAGSRRVAFSGRIGCTQAEGGQLPRHDLGHGRGEEPLEDAAHVLQGRAPVTDPRLGTEIGGYRIEAQIGRGGMGVVYRAEQLALGRQVALKLVAPELAEDPGFRERFQRESHLAASIEHPNVIPVHEAGEAEGTVFISMRYVEGTDLRALIRAAGPARSQQGGAPDRAGGRCPRRRPRQRPGPPRRKAGERADRQRGRCRSTHTSPTSASPSTPPSQGGAHPHRRMGWHRGLRGARTDQRGGRGRAQRRLRARLRVVPDAHGQRAVRT